MPERSSHLTPDEVRHIQEAFARRRRPGSFEPGRWAVSPYNRDASVLGAPFPDHYPHSTTLRDITLRVIEQTPGVTVDRAQRRRLGEALLEAGVPEIEVSAHGWGMSAAALRDEVTHLKSIRPDLGIKMGATQTEAMEDRGYTVLRFTDEAAWGEVLGRYPNVFGAARPVAVIDFNQILRRLRGHVD